MNVGFVGVGTMGSGMAMNVIKGGHNLIVHDIRHVIFRYSGLSKYL